MKTEEYTKDILPHISYNTVLNQIQDGVFITDTDRRIVYWNQGAEDLTGKNEADVRNKLCCEVNSLCKTDSRGTALCGNNCPLLKAIKYDSSGVYPHIVFVNTKWGIDLPVSISFGPIHNAENVIVGGIVVFRDMRDEYRQRKLAGEIQKKMITLGNIRRNGLFIETLYKPSDEIGGDFIEAFFLDDKCLVATVADATGHGISASLFTVIYKTLLHSSFSNLHDPAEILKSVNEGFLNTTRMEGYYLTATMINLNPFSLRGKLSSAGHPPGLIFTKTDKGYRLKEELRIKSIMIGVDENSNFQEIDFSLNKGDFLLLTSDGIIESECTDDHPFGIEGIEAFFYNYQGNDYLNDLMERVKSLSKYTELLDDVSLIRITPVDD